jgi:hypothetical protein
VEGIFFLYLRGEYTGPRFDPQFMLNDPYGRDYGGEGYVLSFLKRRDEQGNFVAERMNRPDVGTGYRYVEVINPKTNERVRYETRMLTQKAGEFRHEWGAWPTVPCGATATADEPHPYFMNCPIPITAPSPRYGVTFDDISTHEDREYWIAGSSLRVIDLQTGEVMAERIGYMMDPALGSKAHGRQQWLFALENACPAFPRTGDNQPRTSDQARNFVEQVLKPKQVH